MGFEGFYFSRHVICFPFILGRFRLFVGSLYICMHYILNTIIPTIFGDCIIMENNDKA